jgi:hypothetical protein
MPHADHRHEYTGVALTHAGREALRRLTFRLMGGLARRVTFSEALAIAEHLLRSVDEAEVERAAAALDTNAKGGAGVQ